jgi:hypothetical protein
MAGGFNKNGGMDESAFNPLRIRDFRRSQKTDASPRLMFSDKDDFLDFRDPVG